MALKPENTEFRSYYAEKENAAAYGRDPFWQMEMVKQAIYNAVTGTEQADLRGHEFTVSVSDDGLSVNIEFIEQA